jgi:hypothetical protein
MDLLVNLCSRRPAELGRRVGTMPIEVDGEGVDQDLLRVRPGQGNQA